MPNCRTTNLARPRCGGMLALVAAATLGLATSAQGAETAAASQIRKWVAELDSDSFAVRERATKRLQRVGTEAYDALLDATRSPSPEVRQRAAFILRDAHWRRLYGDFAEFAARPEERLDVEHGMWLIARLLDPHLRQRDLQGQLDALADRVRARLPKDTAPRRLDPKLVMDTLREVLFVELEFHGADADYMNPLNSSLASVLQRKRGLPILMSHLVIAVGRRLGWPLEGIAAPGRYLLKYDGLRAPDGFPHDDLIMDAFAGGKMLTPEDLRGMFPGLDPDELAEPAQPRATLVRMLNNLETHLYQSGDAPRAELALTCRLLLARDEE